MVAPSIDLQYKLYVNDEIAIRIICVCSLSPLDFDNLFVMVKDDNFIITIEEGHIPSGFGDSVLSQLFQRGFNKKALTIGAKNEVIGAAEAYENWVLPDFAIIENLIKERTS